MSWSEEVRRYQWKGQEERETTETEHNNDWSNKAIIVSEVAENQGK